MIRTLLLRATACCVFSLALQTADASEYRTLIIATDGSDSFSINDSQASANAAARTVHRAIKAMKPGDEIIIRSFGEAGTASRQIDIRMELGRKAKTRPNRVAEAVSQLIASLPKRASQGQIAIQTQTNIVGFIEGQSRSLECASRPARLILFTDGIEWSTRVNGKALLNGSADLPAYAGPSLAGCTVEMRGLGQQSESLGTDSAWFLTLESQWARYFKQAGVSRFAAFKEFQ